MRKFYRILGTPFLIALFFGFIAGKIYKHHTSSEAVVVDTPSAATRFYSIDDLLDAIEQVESGGNANAIGDNGNAIGSYQIWKIYVDDVNRILGRSKYNYTDRKDPAKSRAMVKTYLQHYATESRIGRTPTNEDRARIHNGGPNGYKKECTVKYWKKVLAELEKE